MRPIISENHNFFRLVFLLCSTRYLVTALSETTTRRQLPYEITKPEPSLHAVLQSCFTPGSILENVAAVLTPRIDPNGALSSLALVRLSKQLISLDNKCGNLHDNNPSMTLDLIANEEDKKLWENGLKNAVACLASANTLECQKSLEVFVEGTKGASVISRLLPKDNGIITGTKGINLFWWKPLFEKIIQEDKRLAAVAQPHQLSGLKWSIDSFRLSTANSDMLYRLPQSLQRAYNDLDLPFNVRPGFLKQPFDFGSVSPTDKEDHELDLFTVASFVSEVDFRTEKIQTKSKQSIAERRQTAWKGDEHVPPFEYSGKTMQRVPWSAVVVDVRDRLFEETSHYYDGCLLNLYPDGGSGMRYHIDPGQGVQWGFETAVVSIGATRRFAFRSIPESRDDRNCLKPHSFVLMDGDITEMFNDCQDRFQHTVKTAECKGESAPRVSLVFKKTFNNSG